MNAPMPRRRPYCPLLPQVLGVLLLLLCATAPAAPAYEVTEQYAGLPSDYRGPAGTWDGLLYNRTQVADGNLVLSAPPYWVDGVLYTCASWQEGQASGSECVREFRDQSSDLGITWTYKPANIVDFTLTPEAQALHAWGRQNIYPYPEMDVYRPATQWISLAAGGSHALAVDIRGQLYAWGHNGEGQLGTPANPYATGDVTTPQWTFVGETFQTVGAGAGHSLAVDRWGAVWAWGRNNAGQSGYGDAMPTASKRKVRLQVGTEYRDFAGAVAVAGGNQHSLALLADGTVWAWGEGHSGELGTGLSGPSWFPVQVVTDSGPLTDVVQIDAGRAHSVAVTRSGKLYTWGYNYFGQIGDGTRTNALTAVEITGGSSGWQAAAAGTHFTVAIDTDGNLWGWGDNTQGQLGLGTAGDIQVDPQQATTDGGWIRVSAGVNTPDYATHNGDHVLAIRVEEQDGLRRQSLYGWGLNSRGQIAFNDTTPTILQPHEIVYDDWVQIAAGGEFTMALRGPAWYAAQPPLGPNLFHYGTTIQPTATKHPSDGDAYALLDLRENGVPLATSPLSFVVRTNHTLQWIDGSVYDLTVALAPTLPASVQDQLRASPQLLPAPGQTAVPEERSVPIAAPAIVAVTDPTFPQYSGKWRCDGATGSGGAPAIDRSCADPAFNLTGDGTLTWQYTQVRTLANTFDGIPDTLAVGEDFPAETYVDDGATADLADTILHPPLEVLQCADTGQQDCPVKFVLTGWTGTSGDLQQRAGSFSAPGDWTFAATEDSSITWHYEKQLRLRLQVVPDSALAPPPLSHFAPTIQVAAIPPESSIAQGSTLSPPQDGTSPADAPLVWDTYFTYDAQRYLGASLLVELEQSPRDPDLSLVESSCAGANCVDAGTDASGSAPRALISLTLDRPTELVVRYIDAERWRIGQPIPGWSCPDGTTSVTSNDPTLATDGAFYQHQETLYPVTPFDGATLTCSTDGHQLQGYAVWPTFAEDRQVTRVSSGAGHTLAVDASGHLQGWGSNTAGQLGFSTFPDPFTPLPTEVPLAEPIQAAAAGAEHSLALDADGNLWAWGRGDYGRLGLGDTLSVATPTRIVGTPGGNWVAVYAGANHSLALRSGGILYAWGANHKGQLGDSLATLPPAYVTAPQPTPHPAGLTWATAAAGNKFSLAVDAYGGLWAWGSNDSGAFGNGAHTVGQATHLPLRVTPRSDWQAVFAGGGHTLALTHSGQLWAWGADPYGQVGVPSTGICRDNVPCVKNPAQIEVPATEASFGQAWRAVAAGASHTLAIKEDGSLWAWGDNTHSQLGTPTPGLCYDGGDGCSVAPLRVGSAHHWVAVAAGNGTSVALTGDGQVFSWGDNAAGQLGDGTLVAVASPSAIALASPASEVFDCADTGDCPTVSHQWHIASAPAALDPAAPHLAFAQLHYSDAYATVAEGPNAADPTFQPARPGRSLLRFGDGSGHPHFVVVDSIPFDDFRSGHARRSWPIGTAVGSAQHLDPDGGNGWILQPLAYYDPAAYDPADRAGAILPVNTNVERNAARDLAIAWYRPGAAGIAWPVTAATYAPYWPADAAQIVIAAGVGSGPLPEEQYTGEVYHQDDPAAAGYNPNEEHALLLGNVLYALRDDLNTYRDANAAWVGPYRNAAAPVETSRPYALLKYRDAQSGQWALQVYQVVRGDLVYPVAAGSPITPLTPLDLLPQPAESYADAGSDAWHHRDHKGGHWAKQSDGAGVAVAGRPVALATGDFNADGRDDVAAAVLAADSSAHLAVALRASDSSALQDPPDRYGLGASTPANLAACDADGDTQLDVVVAPTGTGDYALLRGDGSGALGTAEAVAAAALPLDCIPPATPQVGLQVDLDDDSGTDLVVASPGAERLVVKPARASGGFGDATFSQRWYYPLQNSFYYPWHKNDGTPYQEGDPVPFLAGGTDCKTPADTPGVPPLTEDTQEPPDYGERCAHEPAAATYVVSWPASAPELQTGETLTGAKYGLPDLVNMAAVEVLAERAEVGQAPLVRLFDPFAECSTPLDEIPSAIASERSDGKLRFPELPYSLRARLHYDPTTQHLVFGGISLDAGTGEPLLLPNVMTAAERDLLQGLDSNWSSAIANLHTACNSMASESPLPGGSPALSAGNAQGEGYVVLAENDDPSLGAAPVALHVIRVGGGPYRGEVKVIRSDNPFDEKLTLRHSGDFGGTPEAFTFEWYYQPDQTGLPPGLPTGKAGSQWVLFDRGSGLIDITLAGAGKLTLSDNWFTVRYYYGDPDFQADADGDGSPGNDYAYPALGVPPLTGATGPAGDPYNWSDWAGAPGGETAQLAEGWIKRVVDDLNPLDARVKDFRNHPSSTDVSMVSQLGERYEGAVALSGAADNLNEMGLIEAYQTVLDRGQAFSIDAAPPADYGPANVALLNAATRIADFYTLLGNEAYADALDPTVGFDSKSGEWGNMASSIFAFQNQLDSLLEEELTLLRGRDDSLSTTRARPVYNRLFWNFTNGDGEVAYVNAYNLADRDVSGVIDELDAKLMYPQGHGDAWGHYLTGIKGWYALLRHPSYTWEPRVESILVGGSPIPVDYLDERKFARTAAAKAQTGVEIVNLTYRQHYVDDPEGQWQGYKDTDSQRAWGVDGWSRRAAQGALFDWVVANAVLPAEDTHPEHTGIRKIDRTTVPELRELASHFSAVQAHTDQADAGLSPLGLARGVVPFDIDPTFLQLGSSVHGQTHFDQIYGRAGLALRNARAAFDHANEYAHLLRSNEDDLGAFRQAIAARERDFDNRLLEIFGYPYTGDIGASGTYAEGYNGPDLLHYMYMDVPDLTGEPLVGEQVAYKVQWDYDAGGATDYDTKKPFVNYKSVSQDGLLAEITYHRNADSTWISAPAEWGARRAPGRLQQDLSDLIRAHAAYQQGLTELEGLIGIVQAAVNTLLAKHEVDVEVIDHANVVYGVVTAAKAASLVLREVRRGLSTITEETAKTAESLKEALPAVVGLSNDATAPARGTILALSVTQGLAYATAIEAIEATEDALAWAAEQADMERDRRALSDGARFELKQMIEVLQTLEGDARAKVQELYGLAGAMNAALGHYMADLAEGERLLTERETFRKRTAAEIQDYRHQDLGFRVFRNDAVQKYRAAFDLAARYTYLTAAAYDYETTLLGSDPNAGGPFMTDIVRQRALGEIIDDVPVAGTPGLADPLARLGQNFGVYRGQLGLNNPQDEANRFSLRSELFRLREDADAAWAAELSAYRHADLWAVPAYRRYCRPVTTEDGGAEPGLVIPFSTEVIAGRNFFGWPLGDGDSAYDPSQFSTKIRSVGLWFAGYDNAGLSDTPRAYLVPVGADVLRSPSGDGSATREFQVVDQKIPVPFPVSEAEIAGQDWIPVFDSVGEELGGTRRFSAFRAYPDSEALQPAEMTTDTRLVGRSVWNTQWLLIIPGSTLLADPEVGLDRFIEHVADIKLTFETYAYSGN